MINDMFSINQKYQWVAVALLSRLFVTTVDMLKINLSLLACFTLDGWVPDAHCRGCDREEVHYVSAARSSVRNKKWGCSNLGEIIFFCSVASPVLGNSMKFRSDLSVKVCVGLTSGSMDTFAVNIYLTSCET